MSLPAVLGANILEVVDAAASASFDLSLLPMYVVGVVVAGVVGYLAIRLVNIAGAEGKFGKFAYYCWAVGAISWSRAPSCPCSPSEDRGPIRWSAELEAPVKRSLQLCALRYGSGKDG